MELNGLWLGAPIILRGLYNALFSELFFSHSKLNFCERLMVWGLNPLISLEWLYDVYWIIYQKNSLHYTLSWRFCRLFVYYMESLLFVESEILCLFIIQSWRTDYVSSSWSYISCEKDSLIYSFYIKKGTDIHIALYVLATVHKYCTTSARRIPGTCKLMVH